jgi:hypothetical protein
MDLKTHRLRHPSQERHGVQPSRQRSQARSLALVIPKTHEFSPSPVSAIERTAPACAYKCAPAANRPNTSRAAGNVARNS